MIKDVRYKGIVFMLMAALCFSMMGGAAKALKEVLYVFLSAKPITAQDGSWAIVFLLLNQWLNSEKFTSSIAFVVTLLRRLRWQIS